MVVFLTGASGFIGRHLAAALAQAGHTLVLGLHNAATPVLHGRVIAIDFSEDVDAAAWRPRLQGVDVVINAVGVLRATGPKGFDALHVDAPRALFEACEQVGVRRVIQISALGADDEAVSGYHRSKREADRYLASLELWPNGRGRAGGAIARWQYSTQLAESYATRYPAQFLVVRFEDLIQHTAQTLSTKSMPFAELPALSRWRMSREL